MLFQMKGLNISIILPPLLHQFLNTLCWNLSCFRIGALRNYIYQFHINLLLKHTEIGV